MQPETSLGPGDRVPNFQLPDQANDRRSFYHEVTGAPILLLLCPRLTSPSARQLLAGLVARQAEIAKAGSQVFAIGGEGVVANATVAAELSFPYRVFSDSQGQVLAGLMAGADVEARLLLLDGNQRVVESRDGPTDADDLAPLLAIAAAMGRAWDTAETLGRAAPILLLPRVFEPDFCRELIGLWEAEHHEGGFSTGQANTYDPNKKKTLEHVIQDPALRRQISFTLARRVAPELAKVFNYRAPFQFDAHIVMCYQPERQDFFGLHRDDLRPENQRRFALSLNLNDDFEGGELHFPEYAPDGYKMDAGTACIFSCPLLHEARPVTKGRRFVLTSFFCDSDRQAPGGAQQRRVQL